MENSDFNDLADGINDSLARLTVQGLAVGQLVRLLSAEQKASFAVGVRQDVADVMQANANESTPGMDEAMSLQLAALLEAAGQPPRAG